MTDTYRELKEKDYEVYVRAIECAQAICLNNGIEIPSRNSAAVEKMIVNLSLYAMGRMELEQNT